MRGTHLLLIEPDPFLAGIYAGKFAQEHLKTDVAESLTEARKRIKKSTPCAIVIDISINEQTGCDFIREQRSEPATFAIPIIVLTKIGDRETIADAFTAGATEYLLKGHFVPIEAVRKIKKIVTDSAK